MGVELGGGARREGLGLWLARQLEDHGAWRLKVLRLLSLRLGAQGATFPLPTFHSPGPTWYNHMSGDLVSETQWE